MEDEKELQESRKTNPSRLYRILWTTGAVLTGLLGSMIVNVVGRSLFGNLDIASLNVVWLIVLLAVLIRSERRGGVWGERLGFTGVIVTWVFYTFYIAAALAIVIDG